MSADALAPKRRSLTRPTQRATHGPRETLKGDSAPHAQPSNAVISLVLCRSRARSGHAQPAIASMNSENSRWFPEVLYWPPGVLQGPGLGRA